MSLSLSPGDPMGGFNDTQIFRTGSFAVAHTILPQLQHVHRNAPPLRRGCTADPWLKGFERMVLRKRVWSYGGLLVSKPKYECAEGYAAPRMCDSVGSKLELCQRHEIGILCQRFEAVGIVTKTTIPRLWLASPSHDELGSGEHKRDQFHRGGHPRDPDPGGWCTPGSTEEND
ncbi:hypothetical protein FA13DRAFT_1775604 [Coprinellus micaceus]|uniref:Uncharacterized protein n=1 Tax=Coprinellus micaceus TaxID=71717 RepID=A0A4Y7T5V7_COPMI|nr:hypothetical protein FA13DRAFT_1775604 [Coprinellus micaceus]